MPILLSFSSEIFLHKIRMSGIYPCIDSIFWEWLKDAKLFLLYSPRFPNLFRWPSLLYLLQDKLFKLSSWFYTSMIGSSSTFPLETISNNRSCRKSSPWIPREETRYNWLISMDIVGNFFYLSIIPESYLLYCKIHVLWVETYTETKWESKIEWLLFYSNPLFWWKSV